MSELWNWELIEGRANTYYVRGNIYNDSKERFNDGTSVTTSSLQSIDFITGVVETKNSTYKLIN